MKLTDKQALVYVGGAVSASFLNATIAIIKQIYAMGQNLGSTIIRMIRKQSC